MKNNIHIPATTLAGNEQIEYKKDLLKDKLLHNKVDIEHFKRMPFVTFFLYTLISYFALSTFAELYLTFTCHDIIWISYNYNDDPFVINEEGFRYFVYIELIIGLLSMTNTISMIAIFKSVKNGFWVIAYSCTIAIFILALYPQLFCIKYNSIGNIILAKNIIIPFVLWAVLNLKNDKGKNQWQYLK